MAENQYKSHKRKMRLILNSMDFRFGYASVKGTMERLFLVLRHPEG
jgi:hypothetical protein